MCGEDEIESVYIKEIGLTEGGKKIVFTKLIIAKPLRTKETFISLCLFTIVC